MIEKSISDKNDLFKKYFDFLNTQGYSNNSTQRYLGCIKHYTRWAFSNRHGTLSINYKNINNFLKKHLKQCKCQRPASCDIKTNRAALFKLLKFLNISLEEQTKYNHIEKIIHEYNFYLTSMGGFSVSTCLYRQRYAREFLKEIFGNRNLSYKSLTPEKIIKYIGASAKRYNRATVKSFTCSIRNFLKFLQFKGYCNIPLAASVPRIASWKLSTIPEYLDENKINKLLSTFDNSSAMGKRDLAVARCLIDIGLRCSEVANFQLEDINWRTNTIEIKKSKIHRADLIPIPDTLLKALIDYLKNARPKTLERYVFVYHRAPFGKKISPETVRNIIRRAYKKSNFSEKLTGTHILRKSMATLMLKNGATLKQIADVLRHRCIDTTMIYTKVNMAQLAQIALPCYGREL